MIEEWRPIPGFPLYEASSLGRIRGGKRGRILDGTLDRSGYMVVCVFKENGEQTTRKVHRMVCLAFHGPCPNGMECCHSNGNKLDNRPANLRWDTRLNNKADAVRHGQTTKGKRLKRYVLFTEEQRRDIIQSSDPQYIIAKRYGAHYSTISKIKSKASRMAVEQ